jgi:KaiC/GvpD/RAD55 family RecA-like ATPase
MEEKRYGTFIKGFDKKLEGGIPEEHIVLIAGAAGTMKSSVAYNILYNNVKDNGTKALYITLEQSKKSLLNHMTKLGMEPISEDKLAVLDLGMIKRDLTNLGDNTWLKLIKMKVESMKSKGYQILVIDSLSALEVLVSFERPREQLFELFEWLRHLNLTTFLLLETELGNEQVGDHGESFLTDGIITLDMERVDSSEVQRRIRCLKMRGTRHNTGYFNLIFKSNKFQVTKTFAK